MIRNVWGMPSPIPRGLGADDSGSFAPGTGDAGSHDLVEKDPGPAAASIMKWGLVGVGALVVLLLGPALYENYVAK